MMHNSAYGFMLADLSGMPVLLYDYEGYGASEGKSGEKTARRDIEAVYRYVRETYPEYKLIFMGRSIGSVTTVHIANLYANKKAYQEDRKETCWQALYSNLVWHLHSKRFGNGR